MDPYRFSVFAHILFSILLVGLALFWVIMQVALRRRAATGEALRLLGIAQLARWPHVAVPLAWRISLPWLTWLVMAGAWASGIASSTLGGHSLSGDWWPKWLLIAVVTACQLAM